MSSETSQNTEARVDAHLRFSDSDDCYSLYVAVDPVEEIVGYSTVHRFRYLFRSEPRLVLEVVRERCRAGQGYRKPSSVGRQERNAGSELFPAGSARLAASGILV